MVLREEPDPPAPRRQWITLDQVTKRPIESRRRRLPERAELSSHSPTRRATTGLLSRQPTEVDSLQRRRATDVTLCLCARSLTHRHQDAGRLRSALAREVFIAGSTSVTHSNRPSMPSPLTAASNDHRVASPAAHRGEQPSRARGNRGHPSPLREGRAPSDTEMSGGCSEPQVTRRPVYESATKPIEVERRDSILHPAVQHNRRLLLVWRPAAKATRRCSASERPRSHAVAARPAARTQNPRVSRSTTGRRTGAPRQSPLRHPPGCMSSR